jgi:hypothetical protein
MDGCSWVTTDEELAAACAGHVLAESKCECEWIRIRTLELLSGTVNLFFSP